jgi:translation initiation factor 6 (eIF-6)
MEKYIIIENNIIKNVVVAEEYPSFLLEPDQTALKITDITGSSEIGSIHHTNSNSFIPTIKVNNAFPTIDNYISGSTHIIQTFNSKIKSATSANVEVVQSRFGHVANVILNSDSRSIGFDWIPSSSLDTTSETDVRINLTNITNIVDSSINTSLRYIHTGSLEGLNQD